MKIFFACLLVLALPCAQAVAAKTVFVTDKLEILLRSGQGTQYKILSSLESGTPLSVLKSDKGDGWTYVRTEDKKTGWVLTRFLTDSPIAQVQLESANRTVEDLRQENNRMKEELTALKTKHDSTGEENEELAKEKNRLLQELSTIREASSDAINIMEQRNQFKERIINLERELKNLSRENQTLKDSTAQNWFLIGAGVLFGGILLGLILPKLSWRRKTRSWDSF